MGMPNSLESCDTERCGGFESLTLRQRTEMSKYLLFCRNSILEFGYVFIAVELTPNHDRETKPKENEDKIVAFMNSGRFYGNVSATYAEGNLTAKYGGKFELVGKVEGELRVAPGWDYSIFGGQTEFQCIGRDKYSGVFTETEVLASLERLNNSDKIHQLKQVSPKELL